MNEKKEISGPYVSKFGEQYKKGVIVPVTPISPEEHNDRWYLDWARYAYARHCANEGIVSTDGMVSGSRRSIQESRAYGLGEQSTNRYRRQLDLTVDRNGKILPESTNTSELNPESFLNISWENVDIYPAFLNRIIDRIMERSYRPGVVAMDSNARKSKQMAYLKDRFAADANMKAFSNSVGVKPNNVSDEVDSMTQEDVDVLNGLGGYRMAAEMELEEAIVNSFEFSQYEPVVRRQIIEDILNISIGAAHVCGDDHQYIEYVDPARLIAGRSAYADCRDLDSAGFTRELSIAALRAESGFSEMELLEIARNNMSHYGNSRYSLPQSNEFAVRESFQTPFQSSGLDMFKVEVLTLYFVGLDVERFIAGIGKMGGKIFDQVQRSSTLNERNINAGKQVVDSQRQYVFKVNWVIGTEKVYRTGKTEITARDGAHGQMRAILPITMFKTNGKSFTQKVMSIIDDIQIAVLRGRAMMNKMPPPPGLAIDMSAMEQSFNVGDLNMTPETALELYSIRGYYLWASKMEYSLPGEGIQSRVPFQPITSNFMEHLQAINLVLQDKINTLRLVSGMNEITDGSGNPTRVQNGVASAYESSSNRALNEIYTANESFTKSLILNVGRRYQAAMAGGEVTIERVMPMSSTVKTIRLLPEYAIGDFEFYVRPVESIEFRQKLMETLGQSRQEAKISEADYLITCNLINQGRVELAQFYLVRAVAKKQAVDAEQQIAAIQAQSQAQAETAKVTEAAKGEWSVKVADRKMEQIKLTKDLELRNNEALHKQALELSTHNSQNKMQETE